MKVKSLYLREYSELGHGSIEDKIQVFVNSRPNDNPGSYQLFFEGDSVVANDQSTFLTEDAANKRHTQLINNEIKLVKAQIIQGQERLKKLEAQL